MFVVLKYEVWNNAPTAHQQTNKQTTIKQPESQRYDALLKSKSRSDHILSVGRFRLSEGGGGSQTTLLLNDEAKGNPFRETQKWDLLACGLL